MSLSSNRFVNACGVSLAAALFAAGAAGAQTTSGSPTTPPSTGGTMSANAMESTAGAAMPVLREPVAEMFNDAKIAAVASVSNMSEILPSQLAAQRAQSAQVKQFAQRMIAEHQQLEQQMQQMLKAKGVAPEHNAYSYQQQQNLQPTMRELQSASGAAFDKLYMQHQVASHMSTLHALDTSLIPNAKDPQMRAMLQQKARPAVAGHYTESRRILDSLGGSAGAAGMGH
jgi:putative membrane protein